MITECCDEVQYIASDRNILVKAFYNSKFDNIIFDYDEMKRVIHNLLANALKFSYKHKEILVKVKDYENNIMVSIENYGIGIKLENPDDVFEQFISYCEDSKTVSSGLGLYISKQIILAHKGNIHFKSTSCDKTIVTFTLPVKP